MTYTFGNNDYEFLYLYRRGVRFTESSSGLTGRSSVMDNSYYVYILASKKNGTLYIGFTSNLIRRIWEHKNKLVDGFTRKYNVKKLVYFEQYDDPYNAIRREKRLKKYYRQWKLNLIEKGNPEWDDLVDNGFPDQAKE